MLEKKQESLISDTQNNHKITRQIASYPEEYTRNDSTLDFSFNNIPGINMLDLQSTHVATSIIKYTLPK